MHWKYAAHFVALVLLCSTLPCRTVAAQSGPATSFLDIDNPARQRSFFRDAAAEWLGRRIHVHLPSSTLAKATPLPGGGLEFRYRTVVFRIGAKNPSLARYNRGNARGGVLCFKGFVRKTRGTTETFVAAHSFCVGNRKH